MVTRSPLLSSATTVTSRGGMVTEELQAIYVAVMAERSGQLLRQALQRRFEGTGGGVAKKYADGFFDTFAKEVQGGQPSA